jgi:2-oxoglutarate dehydrogenase E2 component (dihydrolipoamide succinyltransferase)
VQLAIAARARPATVICDAQDLNLRGLARALASAHVAGTPVAASTFTIVDLSDPFWGDPSGLARRQSALLGVGAIRRRPLVVADRGIDRIVVHPAALLTLAYDVRVLGQCHADAFLRDVRRRLEHFCI